MFPPDIWCMCVFLQTAFLMNASEKWPPKNSARKSITAQSEIQSADVAELETSQFAHSRSNNYPEQPKLSSARSFASVCLPETRLSLLWPSRISHGTCVPSCHGQFEHKYFSFTERYCSPRHANTTEPKQQKHRSVTYHCTHNDYRAELDYVSIVFVNSRSVIAEIFWNWFVSAIIVSSGFPNLWVYLIERFGEVYSVMSVEELPNRNSLSAENTPINLVRRRLAN